MSRNAAPPSSSSSKSAARATDRDRRPFTDPIEIPPAGARADDDRNEEEEGRCDDDGGGEVVPPHVLLARRRRTAPLSVCSGQGRTLKGRDLQRVRDSVLRMTGFIET